MCLPSALQFSGLSRIICRVDSLSTGEPAALDEIVAAAAVFHEPSRLIEGREALLRRYADFRGASAGYG